MKKPIGVFDSGIGGLTVLKELLTGLPKEDFIYFGDSKNAPYGPKPAEEIIDFSKRIIEFFLERDCKAVVIACNTATAAAVNEMRKMFSIPIIGLEPAVKPACLNTKTGNVGVLATYGTFRGDHFKNTSDKYKDYVKIHLQVAKELVDLAEKGIFSGLDVDREITTYIDPMKENNVDQIVLGCTHYAFFYESIMNIAGQGIDIIDSAKPVTRRTKDVLMTGKMLETAETEQNISFFTSGEPDITYKIICSYLNIEEPEIYRVEL